MPLTFPSHAAAVVPLKLWRPRWFDGVALVIGSAAPDFAYALDPYLHIRAHTWLGLVVFCVPVTVLLTPLTRRGAPRVVTHLPRRGPDAWFALRDYAVVATHRHRWYVTVGSAWLGAASHRLWDMVSHAAIDQGAVRFAVLNQEAFAGWQWWRVVFQVSTIVGAVVVVLYARYIGRRRWMLDGDVTAVSPPSQPTVFWSVAGALWLAGLLAQPFLAGFHDPQIILVRLLVLGCVGLLAGSGATAIHQPEGAAR